MLEALVAKTGRDAKTGRMRNLGLLLVIMHVTRNVAFVVAWDCTVGF